MDHAQRRGHDDLGRERIAQGLGGDRRQVFGQPFLAIARTKFQHSLIARSAEGIATTGDSGGYRDFS